MSSPHWVVAVSGHGFGHAMQTCLVLNALRARLPDLKLTLRTQVPAAFLKSRLRGEFTLLPHSTDTGMLMHSAVDVDTEASGTAYEHFHADWPQRVSAEAEILQELQADAVLSNVAYPPLAGAAQAGIPAAALCSLNWADIYCRYCHTPSARRIHAEILEAYRNAQVFLQPVPHMPMADLPNIRSIGPLAQTGTRRPLARHLGLSEDRRIVLVGLGGIDLPLPVHTWPKDIVWLVPRAWGIESANIFALENLPWPFIDVLRSSDALLTKPGYGSFTEAACNGIPVVYVERPDWPETPYLADWLHRHTQALTIDRETLESGAFTAGLETPWQAPALSPPPATGAEEAAVFLLSKM